MGAAGFVSFEVPGDSIFLVKGERCKIHIRMFGRSEPYRARRFRGTAI